LAFGASGHVAGLVAAALAERKVALRGFVKDEAGAERAKANGVGEIFVGNLTDSAMLNSVLEGIERVFYIAPAFMPQEAETGVRLVEACVAAGVKRFVFSSVIHPVLSSLSNHAAKAPVEEAVLDSGMEYTFLHPGLFFQNYEGSWRKIAQIGQLAEPWSSETKFSRVDYRDVAEVAAIAITEDRLLHGTFELCADGWLDRHDVARLAGEALGQEIKAVRIDPDTLDDDTKPMRPMFEHYDRVGLCGNSLTLRAILGREPRSLKAYFEELAKSKGHQNG
jgi:uncharacterized protein YbjT (DUF2867 family)